MFGVLPSLAKKGGWERELDCTIEEAWKGGTVPAALQLLVTKTCSHPTVIIQITGWYAVPLL
jgi:hypothetical protein